MRASTATTAILLAVLLLMLLLSIALARQRQEDFIPSVTGTNPVADPCDVPGACVLGVMRADIWGPADVVVGNAATVSVMQFAEVGHDAPSDS